MCIRDSVYTDRASGEVQRIALEGVFVQIGLLPNSDWLKGTIALSRHGEIEVDARGETSLPGVCAAGDVTTVPYKQIVIAMGEGSKACLLYTSDLGPGTTVDHAAERALPAARFFDKKECTC